MTASVLRQMGANENPLGPSPHAQAAMAQALADAHRYPDPDGLTLKRALQRRFGLDPQWLLVGNGSSELIDLAARSLLGRGDEAVHSQYAFVSYPLAIRVAGGTAVEAPARDFGHDLAALRAAVGPRTRLVFIANPNNPTGTMIAQAELARLADGLPKQAILVLDGAYAEYVEGYDAGRALIEARENVVMTRTFSKIYGLGGLRIGWGYGPQHIIEVLNRIRGPFNLSTTQLEVAEAAVRDQDWVAKCRSENSRMRAWLAEALAELGVPSDTSTANFVLARFADAAEAEACDAYLKSQGLIVRQVTGYKLPHCLRITVGDESSCRRVAHAVAQFKGQR